MSAVDGAGVARDGYEPRIHRGTVVSVQRPSAGMVRITLGGDDMRDYPTTAVGDEYVRLFFPDHPDADVRMPVVSEHGWDFEEGVEPSPMRTYTIRAHRPGEVDIDFVEHRGGIAASWASQARVGQHLAINPPRPLYERPGWARRQVLVADEPALPAALRIAELTAGEVETHVVAEVRGAGFRLESELVGATCTWLDGTGNGLAPSALVDALRRTPLDDRTWVWVASETRVSREVRAHLRRERALAKDACQCVGYWTAPADEGSVHHAVHEQGARDEPERALQPVGP